MSFPDFGRFTRSPIFKLAAVGALCLAVAACSAAGLASRPGSPAGAAGPATPKADQAGTGEYVVGLLAADADGNLSDGLANSVYLAGRLAAATLSGTPVTLVIRRYEPLQSSLDKAAAELIAAGARIVIGPDDDKGAGSLAALLKDRNIPIISLSGRADGTSALYAAGLDPDREASVAVAEMRRRGYAAILVVVGADKAARAYGAALLAAAAPAGIEATRIDASKPAETASGLGRLGGAGRAMPDAVVFATGPVTAAAVMAAIPGDSRYAGVPIVGNSGWSVSPQLIPRGSTTWYTALAGNNLSGFAQRFAAANGGQPSLQGALAYDLVVMAGALPQIVPEAPYAADVLANAKGFNGQTGAFRFDGNGLAQRSFVVTEVN